LYLYQSVIFCPNSFTEYKPQLIASKTAGKNCMSNLVVAKVSKQAHNTEMSLKSIAFANRTKIPGIILYSVILHCVILPNVIVPSAIPLMSFELVLLGLISFCL
jgi:hypothetical protein